MKKIKKIVVEMIVFGVVVITSSALLCNLTPTYKATGIQASGNTSLAMLKVPVPIEPTMEGQKVDYKVRCTVKRGVLECAEAG